MKVILVRYADVAGQHYGPGTRLVVSDDLGEALVQQDRARPAEEIFDVQVDATDSARKLAYEKGIDLTKIVGSGVGGRILVSDVQQAITD